MSTSTDVPNVIEPGPGVESAEVEVRFDLPTHLGGRNRRCEVRVSARFWITSSALDFERKVRALLGNT